MGLFSDWSPLLPYMADGTAHYAEKVGDTQHIGQTNCALRVTHEMGGRWKSQHRKIVPPSPYVEKPLNSKVIKSFVPELRSRKCFSRFEIPMFYVYMLWTFYERFTYPYLAMLHIQVCLSWTERIKQRRSLGRFVFLCLPFIISGEEITWGSS